jgi:hypothetical protein
MDCIDGEEPDEMRWYCQRHALAGWCQQIFLLDGRIDVIATTSVTSHDGQHRRGCGSQGEIIRVVRQWFAMNGSSDNPSSGSERPARRRHYVQGRARVLLPPARSFDAEMVDISEGGVCLTSPVEVAIGTWCDLRIEMPPRPAAQILVSGYVCFCVEQHGAYRVGVHVGVHCADSDSLVAAV